MNVVDIEVGEQFLLSGHQLCCQWMRSDHFWSSCPYSQ